MRYLPSRAAMSSLRARTMTHKRRWSLPCSASAFSASMVANCEPASWNHVTPCVRHSSWARRVVGCLARVRYCDDGFRLPQVQHHFRLAEANEMAVALDEARHGEAAGQVDHLGLVADQLGNRVIRADGDDAAAAGGQRLGDGVAVVHCDDLAVAQDE